MIWKRPTNSCRVLGFCFNLICEILIFCRFDQTTYQEELKRLREQNVQLEKEARTNRRDADEAQIAMAKS